MHLLLPLILTASAGDYLVSVSDQHELMMAGTWGRAIPVDGGWRYAFGRNNDYWVAPLEREGDGWVLDRDQEIQLTDTGGQLKDYAIRRCPDGTFLLTASANVEQPNDSAYAWRFDGDFNEVQYAVIEEREPARAHNDMPLLCSASYTGTAFSSMGMGSNGNFFPIGEDLSSAPGAELPMGANTTGASMIGNRDGTFHFITASPEGNLLRFTFDGDLNVVDQRQTPVAESPDERTYWPQSVLRIGDYYVVAMMSRNLSWPGDDGDVILVVLDDEWNDLADRVNVTNNPSDNLGMRPWLARKGSTLLVTYDRQREHTVIEVELDLAAFGLDEDDSGFGDGSWSDTDGGGGGNDGGNDGDGAAAGDTGAESGGGCSCASATGMGALGWLGGLLALASRRRRA